MVVVVPANSTVPFVPAINVPLLVHEVLTWIVPSAIHSRVLPASICTLA